MILQSLVRYYDILVEDEDSIISLPGYSKTNISYALNISKEGELLEVLPLRYNVMRGKKEVEVARAAIVPQQVKKTSGINSNFLCENSAYVLGIDKKGKPERAKKCFESFKMLHNEILSEVKCDEAIALLNFLNNWDVDAAAAHEVIKEFYDKLVAGVNIVFKLDNGAYLHECSKLKLAWSNYNIQHDEGTIMQCLITGERAPIARLNPAIKGVKGAQSVGASVVSFNGSAYESYGRDKMQGLNAPISQKAAFAYGTVLNYLIADRAHSLSVGDTTTVYWAESADNTRRDETALCFDSDELMKQDESKQIIHNVEARQLVGGILKKIANGQKISDYAMEDLFEDETLFYVLGLAPNAARISIRFFMQNTFGNFMRNIMKHYEDLSIDKQFDAEPIFISPKQMLTQTVSSYSKDDSASPLLGGSVMRAILNGTPYPESLFQMIIVRIKAEHDINYYKAAIIKAYLIRKNRKQYEEVLNMSLNSESNNTAYLLGRLFAVLEKVQKDANPGINSTIKDRRFTSACSTPASSFPSLLRLAQHHISKSKYGYVCDNMIANILEKLEVTENPFPKTLPLDDQGIFVLGYYHQRNQLYVKGSKNVVEEDVDNE